MYGDTHVITRMHRKRNKKKIHVSIYKGTNKKWGISWVEPEQDRRHLALRHNAVPPIVSYQHKSHISDLMILPLILRALRAVAFICHDMSYKQAWSTHRYHVSVGVVGGGDFVVVVVRVITFLVGFRLITLEGLHQFHSNFTEGSNINKCTSSSKREVLQNYDI